MKHENVGRTANSMPIVCHTVGQDYVGTSQVLNFPPGVSEMCTSFLTILGDDIIEPNERILITLTTPNTDVVIGGSTFITILDDDREFPVPFVMGFPLILQIVLTLHDHKQNNLKLWNLHTPLVVHMPRFCVPLVRLFGQIVPTSVLCL